MTVITQERATTWTFNITGMGSLAGRTALYFAIKRVLTDGDADAMVLIEETAGLQVINGGVAPTAGNGSITVTDVAAGNITVTLAAVESAKLNETRMAFWGVKMVTAAAVEQLDSDRFNVSRSVVEAIA